MTSLWVEIRNGIEADIAKLKPELEKIETILKNVQAELAPLEGAALKAIGSAAISGALGALGGGSLTLSVAEAAVIAGGRAALAAASKQGATLSEQGALAIAAATGVTAPTVANGANG